MKVLITGATGLIGQHLTAQLHDANVDIHYLTTSRYKIEQRPNYKGFFWDSKTQEIDVACLEGVSTIVHLAGASIAERWTTNYKKVILNSRIKTADLLHKTLSENEHQVKHFVSASAIGAYPSSLTELYTESYPKYNSGFLGEVVEKWESAADRFENLGLKVSKVRVGVVLAEKGGALEQLVKPIKMYVGAPLGDGQQWQSWIHIKDLAGIFRTIIEQKLEGIYNAVAPNPVTNETLTKESAKVLKKPLILPNVPPFALKLLLGEMAAIVLESQRVSSSKIENVYNFRFTHLQSALKDLLP